MIIVKKKNEGDRKRLERQIDRERPTNREIQRQIADRDTIPAIEVHCSSCFLLKKIQ